MDLIYLAPVAALIALAFAGYSFMMVKREGTGTEVMQKIAAAIHLGAMVYLNRQYRAIAVFVVVLAIVLAIGISPLTAACFILGAVLSATAGYIGMYTATAANVRTTNAARRGIAEAFRVSFSSGSVMGMAVVGLGLFGLSLAYLALSAMGLPQETVLSTVTGFGLGASSIALFARVGGGIFTKAADVGADLVGKVEAGIPEDDPRNPAVIADNVGDNVGDVAGMGADLYESYVGSIIAAMVLGITAVHTEMYAGLDPMQLVLLPMMIAALGIFSAIIGSFFVRTNKTESSAIHMAFNKGLIVAIILVVIATYFLVTTLIGPQYVGIFYAAIAGLVAGFAIGLITEYYTSYDRAPTLSIAKSAQTGSATTIISGFAKGMESTVFPVFFVSIAIIISYQFAGLYGIAIAAVGIDRKSVV